MTSASPLPPELVAEHATALQRLAYSLTGCRHAADDAVQETWLRAMRTRRSSVVEWGAWLRTVLRNVVASRHRTELRRSRHDVDAHQGYDPPNSPVDLLERRETLRVVMGAVMRLDDDLQSVVFLRHFDRLAPRDIAARLGLPVDVVYRRLKVARERLRADLEREWRRREGSWQAAVFALFGRRSRWPAFLEGALVMTLNTKLMVSIAALLMLAAPLAFITDDPDVVPHEPATVTAENSPNRVVAEVEAESRRDVVVDATEASAMAAAIAPFEGYEFRLLCRVTDQFDLPYFGVGLLAGPALHELNRVGKTDSDGLLEVRWRGTRPAMEILVASAEAPGSLRSISVRAGRTAHVGFQQLRPIVTSRGTELSRLLVATMPSAGDVNVPAMEAAGDGFGRFVAPWRPRAAVVDGGVAFDVELPMFASFSYEEVATDAESPLPAAGATVTSLEGRVLRAPGDPAAPIHVVAFSPSGERRELETDSDDRFVLRDIEPGTWRIRAGGQDHGVFEASVICEEGRSTHCTARLDRGHELVGRVVDDSGAPLEGLRVHAELADAGGWFDVSETDAHGRFAIANAPAGAVDVSCFRSNAGGAEQPIARATMWPNGTVHTVEVPASARECGVVVLEISVTDRAQWRGLVGRLRDASGCGHAFSFAEGRAELTDVVAGDYRIEIGGGATAWSEYVAFRVDPGRKVDLGVLQLPPPARLVLPDEIDVEIARRGRDVVSMLVEDDPSPGSLQLLRPFPIEGEGEASELAVLSFAGEESFAVSPVLTQFFVDSSTLESSASESQQSAATPMADAIATPGVPLAPGRYVIAVADGEPHELVLAPGQVVELDQSGSTSEARNR